MTAPGPRKDIPFDVALAIDEQNTLRAFRELAEQIKTPSTVTIADLIDKAAKQHRENQQ